MRKRVKNKTKRANRSDLLSLKLLWLHKLLQIVTFSVFGRSLIKQISTTQTNLR